MMTYDVSNADEDEDDDHFTIWRRRRRRRRFASFGVLSFFKFSECLPGSVVTVSGR